jgi:hypothetical protein
MSLTARARDRLLEAIKADEFDDGRLASGEPARRAARGQPHDDPQRPSELEPAGANGQKTNFGFNVKPNKAGTTLQGNINTIVRNGGNVYQIKGNAMTSLVAKVGTASTPGTANFEGKANIQDITNPLAPVSVDGNATLRVTMTDAGEPGSKDLIGITVWNKNGGVWFSSNWDGAKTLEQLLGGGNLAVR